MSWIAAAVVGSAVVGAGAGIYASGKASSAQEKAAEAAGDTTLTATRLSIEAQERQLITAIELNEPFREAGLEVLPQLVQEVSEGAPTFDDYVESPEAAAIRDQELEDISKATERTAAARGNLFAPSTQLALQDKALEKTRASKLGQFDASLARRKSDINDRFNLVNVGRGATTQQVSDVGATGSNISNLIMSGGLATAEGQLRSGDARASGYINTGNVISSGVAATTGNLLLANALK